VIPGSEFSVSRTAHRNNTSNYFIGTRKSNFSEVTDLLKSKGIDLDNNRFLILQVCFSAIEALVWCHSRSHSPPPPPFPAPFLVDTYIHKGESAWRGLGGREDARIW